MKAHGNGAPETCAANLLRIVRGEVPFDRVRGRDGALVDRANAAEDIIADAEWVIETYEPRVAVEDAETFVEAALTGEFTSGITIARKEEAEE